MNTPRAKALQMCPFSAYLEAGLLSRFDVVRWFELAPAAQADWLKAHAESVRAIATGGHIGCPPDLMKALPQLGLIAINGVGVDKVDLALAPPFRKAAESGGKPLHFAHDGHWTAAGHRLAAELTADFLRRVIDAQSNGRSVP